jgi:membrane-bound lytic murein transglycosylase B
MSLRTATTTSLPLFLASLLALSGGISSQVLAQASATPIEQEQPSAEDFQHWLIELEKDVLRKGIKPSTWQAVLPYLVINEQVLALDRQQPEFTQTFWTYLNKRMTDIRIQAGKLQYFRYESLLKRLETEHGVPAEILLAFWGLETNYGTFLGNTSTLSALTTLAVDPRRSSFFRKELIAAITIVDQGHVTPEDMKGSWAGAVGQMQFMPSIFLRHAQDGDGDHKINLWSSTEDALTSAAAFLQAAGWQAGTAWGQEVILPKGFNYALADGQTPYSVAQLTQLGVKPVIQPWRSPEKEVLLWAPAGHRGPSFATYANFAVIKKWNRSNHYAFTVGLMADTIVHNHHLSVNAPENVKPWPKDFTRQLQQRLLDLGYDIGKVDGWLGQNTARAIRAFQQEKGLIADGYPDAETLRYLQINE